MDKNVGGIDHFIRIIAGLAIIAWGVFTQNWWGALGILPLATSLVRRCLLYRPFGLSTCKEKT